MSYSCRRFTVNGRVQGVFFRSTTQRKATELGLVGWVKNLANGDVELVACGTEEYLKKLEEWLWQGPIIAKVLTVTSEECPREIFAQFEIR